MEEAYCHQQIADLPFYRIWKSVILSYQARSQKISKCLAEILIQMVQITGKMELTLPHQTIQATSKPLLLLSRVQIGLRLSVTLGKNTPLELQDFWTVLYLIFLIHQAQDLIRLGEGLGILDHQEMSQRDI